MYKRWYILDMRFVCAKIHACGVYSFVYFIKAYVNVYPSGIYPGIYCTSYIYPRVMYLIY